MTLTDPREALADNSSFIDYLLGLTGLARMVRALADDPQRVDVPRQDDFVHVLVGLARLGDAVENLSKPTTASAVSTPATPGSSNVRWLR
jgi:hypothetical protein